MSNAKDIIATAAMDEQAEVSWPVLLAKKHAHATAVAESHAEGSELLTFEPAEWVINAIREAHGMGMIDGRANGNAVAEAQAEQHSIERSGIVRATIAAILESQIDVFKHANETLPYTTFEPSKLATVFDRVDLDFTLHDNGKVTYRLYPAARKPDGAA